jgi:hypothetical protein
MRYYKGASIMLLINCPDKLLVMLFGDSDYEIHMDLGGHAEDGEIPEETAQRECQEESLNTFLIDKKSILNYFDYFQVNNYAKYKDYYGFFIQFDGDINLIKQIEKIYSDNLDIIFSSKNSPSHWKETKVVSFFTIDSLLNGQPFDNYYFSCQDIYSNDKIIHPRPIRYLENAIKKGVIKHNYNGKLWSCPYFPIKNILVQKNTDQDEDYLNNTVSLVLL